MNRAERSKAKKIQRMANWEYYTYAPTPDPLDPTVIPGLRRYVPKGPRAHDIANFFQENYPRRIHSEAEALEDLPRYKYGWQIIDQIENGKNVWIIAGKREKVRRRHGKGKERRYVIHGAIKIRIENRGEEKGETGEPNVLVSWVMVDEPKRQRKLGLRLLRRAVNIAIAAGAESIYADIHELNDPSRRLFRKANFVEEPGKTEGQVIARRSLRRKSN